MAWVKVLGPSRWHLRSLTANRIPWTPSKLSSTQRQRSPSSSVMCIRSYTWRSGYCHGVTSVARSNHCFRTITVIWVLTVCTCHSPINTSLKLLHILVWSCFYLVTQTWLLTPLICLTEDCPLVLLPFLYSHSLTTLLQGIRKTLLPRKLSANQNSQYTICCLPFAVIWHFCEINPFILTFVFSVC